MAGHLHASIVGYMGTSNFLHRLHRLTLLSAPHSRVPNAMERNASEFTSFARCDIFLLLLGPSVKVTYSAKSFQEYMLNGYLFSSMRLEGDDERFKIKLHYRDLHETRRVTREYLKSNTIPGVEALAIISESKGELQ